MHPHLHGLTQPTKFSRSLPFEHCIIVVPAVPCCDCCDCPVFWPHLLVDLEKLLAITITTTIVIRFIIILMMMMMIIIIIMMIIIIVITTTATIIIIQLRGYVCCVCVCSCVAFATMLLSLNQFSLRHCHFSLCCCMISSQHLCVH